MTAKPPFPDSNQYGLKDEDDEDHGNPAQTYANRTGGEQPGVGPADAVDASGHRLGKIEERPVHTPSSPSPRGGRADTGEANPKKR